MKKNKIVLAAAVSLVLLSSATLIHIFKTHNKSTDKVIGKENIKEKLDTLAVYIKDKDSSDYIQTESIPAKGSNYKFNSSKSTCTNNVTLVWDNDTWDINLMGITKGGTSCYLYFDEQEEIAIYAIIAGGTATDDSMFNGTTGDGVYIWSKGDCSGGKKKIKYYRGNVDNNWVVFGKDGDNYIWWRIIRNNSNGSLRMIYAGTSESKTSAPATTGEGTQIGTKAYNTSYNNNMYVGFKYTNEQVHGNGTPSTILGETNSTDKTTLYGWYNATLAKSTTYSDRVDLDAGFCNDRTPKSGSGTGTVTTYYAARQRLISTNKTPTLSCTYASDIFKTPVGLITADEAIMGGMAYGSSGNTSSYLHTNSNYRTMTPFYFINFTSTFGVSSNGGLTNHDVSVATGVRPVVNLKFDTLFETGGNGSSTSPYVVQGT